MALHRVHVFIDGGFIREGAREAGCRWPTARSMCQHLVSTDHLQSWARDPRIVRSAMLQRIRYYDAFADSPDSQDPKLQAYWREVELEDDVHLGFGELRGLRRRVRQKGVDTLIAVDMIVGAYGGLFDIALLIAGDADFVPVLEEVKRRGIMVAVASPRARISDELRRCADRFLEVDDSWWNVWQSGHPTS